MANYDSQTKGRDKARIINAPRDEPPTGSRRSLFLSGSTDGADWRAVVSRSLDHLPISIYNPVRPDWDSTWIPDTSFTPFREQVEWELKMLESVDVIAVYFSPRSESPITLLELGLFANSKKVVVACPKEFWRRGNVEIVCNRYGVKFVENLDDLVEEVERRLTEKRPEQLRVAENRKAHSTFDFQLFGWQPSSHAHFLAPDLVLASISTFLDTQQGFYRA